MNTPMTRRHRLLRLPLAFCLMCAAACAATTAPSAAALHGDWVLLTVDGTPADTAHARLSFDDQAHFTATAGCNRIFGSYRTGNGRLTLPPAASTLRACDEALMAAENRLHRVLANLNNAPFTITQNRLTVRNRQGRTVLEARRLQAGETP
ncbi:META domain-containing protein [Conchiformibius kuhniae]|uniref:META domain-containing protein n=1 Tax=Conchiformibius kuhniae TaxID=211502 RepID=A0ABD8B856_9NEIS|nr:META domain-containing protein [Conchiformibius kuhniae]